MPSVYTKKGFNPISATNLFKGHPKYKAGDPVKKQYEKRGFNPLVLQNLIPKQKGTGQKVCNNGGRRSHNEYRDKERKAARLLRNSEREEKEEAKSNANEKKREKDLRAEELLAERGKRREIRLEAKEKVFPFRLVDKERLFAPCLGIRCEIFYHRCCIPFVLYLVTGSPA